MSPEERRAGASLASLFGLRMLGLFFILPLLSVEAHKLAGGENLTLVGLALGAYGLTQAVMQIPFGMASDRWGRKPVIVVGLLLFAAGSVLAGAAHSIYTVIAGRVVQGAGAISSVVVALAADLTREQQRTKAMAMIGSTIGLAFALSLVIAPVLYRWIGLSGVFYVTAGFSLIAIWLLFSAVPKAPRPTHAEPPVRARDLPALLKQPELVRLNVGIFALHVSQMSMFVVVPPMLVEAGLPLPAHWKFYLPVVLASFILMVPAVFYADRRNHHKTVLLGTVLLLALVELGLAAAPDRIMPLAGLMLAFFVAFNVLEALLPSLVSRIAPARARGTAIAVYNTTQTLGLFVGGVLGGWLAHAHGPGAVFSTCAGLAAIWLLAAAGMRPLAPRHVNGMAQSDVSRSGGA
ncbi:MAG: MFS transporter [Sphingomonadaceae bacterium]